MAASTVQSNNKAVKYRGRAEHEMATKKDGVEVVPAIDTPKKLGPKFKKLPKHVRKARVRGMISDAAMKKHYGGV